MVTISHDESHDDEGDNNAVIRSRHQQIDISSSKNQFASESVPLARCRVAESIWGEEDEDKEGWACAASSSLRARSEKSAKHCSTCSASAEEGEKDEE